MKNILFLINSISNKGGSERVASILANAFSSENFKVTVACFDSSPQPAYFLNKKIQIISINSKNIFEQAIRVSKIMKLTNPEIILSHNMGRLSLLTSVLPWPKNVKFFSLEHVSYKSNPFYIKIAKFFLYRRFTGVITLTERDESIYKLFSKKTITIQNPTPFSENHFSYDQKNKNILAIGRLTEQKGFDLLIDIWRVSQPKLEDWNLIIIGEGPEKNNLLKYIKNKAIQNIKILNPQENIEAYYKQAAFFVLSSRYEGLPMVLIEAQSFSLPAISFNCPNGPSELIDESNGFLVNCFDKVEFSKKIIDLANNSHLREKFALSAYENSKKFKINTLVEKWINFFNN